MSKRYCFSPIVGDGTPPMNAYRSAIEDLGTCNVVNYIPSNPDGTPKHAYTLSRVASTNWVPVAAIPGVYIFPDVSLGVLLSAMQPSDIQIIKNELDAHGIDWVTWLTPDITFGTLIYAIGQRIEPGFNINSFDCAEIAV
jgi:hypothetical protein